MDTHDNFSPEFMKEFCENAFRIAEKKMAEGIEFLKKNPPAHPMLPRLSTGGGFSGLFLWDTAFCTMWAKYAPERFPITTSLDNFYNLQEEDGFICREFQGNGKPYWSRHHPISFNPPILAWAEIQLFESGITDIERLKKVYPHLKRHHDFCWKTYRRDDGLFFGDALGGGMDDLPRMPKCAHSDTHDGIDIQFDHILAESKVMWQHLEHNDLYCWNKQMGWIDISSQMALNALNLKKIAQAIGNTGDAGFFAAQHAELTQIINEKCWDEKRHFYFDYYNGAIVPRYHAGAFWVLVAGIVPQERVKGIVEVLCDPAIFNRTVPFPSLGACEPDYDPEHGYWLGSVWPPTNYVALRGLKELGEFELAKEFARRYYNANAELYRKYETIFENISPEQFDHPKMRAARDFCGWGGLVPVAIYHEFLLEK